MTQPNGMYLVLPVPFRMAEGKVFVEWQAANGPDRSAERARDREQLVILSQQAARMDTASPTQRYLRRAVR